MYRRASERYKDLQINAVIRNRTQRFEVAVLNISRGGLRFISRDIFRRGEKLNFELHLENGETTSVLRLNARIVNIYDSEADGHLSEYGVRFSFFGLFSKYGKYRTEELKIIDNREG